MKRKAPCKHPWCILSEIHKLPHKNKYGSRWSQKTCINRECQGPVLEFRELLRDRWTPCCRNTRYWNEDGTLGGDTQESLFCERCGTVVGSVEIEPILRAFYKNRKSGKPPKVWHDRCRPGKHPTFSSLEEDDLYHGILNSFREIVLWTLSIQGTKKHGQWRVEFSEIPLALKEAMFAVMNLDEMVKQDDPGKVAKAMERLVSELYQKRKKIEEDSKLPASQPVNGGHRT